MDLKLSKITPLAVRYRLESEATLSSVPNSQYVRVKHYGF